MKKLANKIFDKKRKYFRRKQKTNTATKENTNLPRVIVNRSNSYIYAQAVDRSGNVLAAGNDLKLKEGTKKEKAYEVGQNLGKTLLDKGVDKVAFDRNGFPYHGRVANVAEGLRQSGVKV